MKRRSTVVGFAVVLGALAFLGGLAWLFAVPSAGGTPREELFEINAFLGSAMVNMALGGVLVVQAASALGGGNSRPWRVKWPWLLLPLFPTGLLLGQWLVDDPERLPWLFPVANLAVVVPPSLIISAVVTRRYLAMHPLAWPMSWREWSSAIIYGAIGAAGIASILNTFAIVLVASFFVSWFGEGPVFPLEDSFATLPKVPGVLADLAILCGVAPIDEEFWKGMIVGFYFYRRGGAARCFVWGVLAGAGFNLLETFQNSLAVVNPDAVSMRTIEEWWKFGIGRAGTATVHSCATGLSALGLYGLFRRRWRFALLYPVGMSVHGAWNFLSYTVEGDQFLSRQGPDTLLLDIAGIAGLIVLAIASLVALWALPGRLSDEGPAPVYAALGMKPGLRTETQGSRPEVMSGVSEL